MALSTLFCAHPPVVCMHMISLMIVSLHIEEPFKGGKVLLPQKMKCKFFLLGQSTWPYISSM